MYVVFVTSDSSRFFTIHARIHQSKLCIVHDDARNRDHWLLQVLLVTKGRGLPFFTARRYANTIHAMALCLSVRPSVTRPILYRNYWANRAGFGMEASFHLSHTVL